MDGNPIGLTDEASGGQRQPHYNVCLKLNLHIKFKDGRIIPGGSIEMHGMGESTDEMTAKALEMVRKIETSAP